MYSVANPNLKGLYPLLQDTKALMRQLEWVGPQHTTYQCYRSDHGNAAFNHACISYMLYFHNQITTLCIQQPYNRQKGTGDTQLNVPFPWLCNSRCLLEERKFACTFYVKSFLTSKLTTGSYDSLLVALSITRFCFILSVMCRWA